MGVDNTIKDHGPNKASSPLAITLPVADLIPQVIELIVRLVVVRIEVTQPSWCRVLTINGITNGRLKAGCCSKKAHVTWLAGFC